MTTCLYWYTFMETIEISIDHTRSPLKDLYNPHWRESLISHTKRLPWSGRNCLVASLFLASFLSLPSQFSQIFWNALSPRARDPKEIPSRTNSPPLWLRAEKKVCRASIPNKRLLFQGSRLPACSWLLGFGCWLLAKRSWSGQSRLSGIQTCFGYLSNLVIFVMGRIREGSRIL